jgi:hypothetical protein
VITEIPDYYWLHCNVTNKPIAYVYYWRPCCGDDASISYSQHCYDGNIHTHILIVDCRDDEVRIAVDSSSNTIQNYRTQPTAATILYKTTASNRRQQRYYTKLPHVTDGSSDTIQSYRTQPTAAAILHNTTKRNRWQQRYYTTLPHATDGSSDAIQHYRTQPTAAAILYRTTARNRRKQQYYTKLCSCDCTALHHNITTIAHTIHTPWCVLRDERTTRRGLERLVVQGREGRRVLVKLVVWLKCGSAQTLCESFASIRSRAR